MLGRLAGNAGRASPAHHFESLRREESGFLVLLRKPLQLVLEHEQFHMLHIRATTATNQESERGPHCEKRNEKHIQRSWQRKPKTAATPVIAPFGEVDGCSRRADHLAPVQRDSKLP